MIQRYHVIYVFKGHKFNYMSSAKIIPFLHFKFRFQYNPNTVLSPPAIPFNGHMCGPKWARERKCSSPISVLFCISDHKHLSNPSVTPALKNTWIFKSTYLLHSSQILSLVINQRNGDHFWHCRQYWLRNHRLMVFGVPSRGTFQTSLAICSCCLMLTLEPNLLQKMQLCNKTKKEKFQGDAFSLS